MTICDIDITFKFTSWPSVYSFENSAHSNWQDRCSEQEDRARLSRSLTAT